MKRGSSPLEAGRHIYFATCAPGLEPVLHDEVRALRLAKSERQVGGVRFEGSLTDAWRANLELRTAIRVLLRLGRFAAPDADALYEGAARVDWGALLRREGTLWIDAQVRDSCLTHSGFVAQRVKDAVVDRLRGPGGERPEVAREDADLRLHVHLFRDRATLAIDTSGPSLHKRGWRVAQGRAPLAETLAAGLVLRSGWDRRAPLLDPFAGSGTILVEAGLIAADVAPGLFREGFAFERLPGHDPAALEAYRGELRARAGTPRARLIGTDVDPEHIEAARANVASAGLDARIELDVADARDFAPRPGWNAWIATNLPYGERVGRRGALIELHRAFGARLAEHCAGSTLALLAGSLELVRALGLPGLESAPAFNGGLECVLVTGRIEERASA